MKLKSPEQRSLMISLSFALFETQIKASPIISSMIGIKVKGTKIPAKKSAITVIIRFPSM